MVRNVAQLLCGVIAAFMLTVGVCSLVFDKAAFADEETEARSSEMTAYELQLQIEEAQSAYGDALEEVDQANEAIEAARARIAELEEQLPAQQARSQHAARELYKFQQQGTGIVEMLLGAGSFHDFLVQFDYMSQIADANVREMNRLAEMQREIENTQAELRKTYDEASAKAAGARSAMEGLQEAQAEVQRRIEEEARLAAEIAAQAQALAEEPRDNDTGEPVAAGASDTGNASEGAASDDGGEGASPDEGGDDGAGSGGAVNAPDPADASDEGAFVAQWAPRIDAYLAGSPLAGQGATFARAAFEYNVDPRWSPAISFTESSKGLYCFKPHNAWGWGSVSWDSWEEAIFAHVGGLSRGYGYTISTAAAQKYCPPNWQTWYDRTLAQMNLI